jgi:D-alanyl-D-alanine carboxypeptidase
MKGFQVSNKKIKSSFAFIRKFHVFEVVIILFFLNFVAFLVAIIYIQRINTFTFPNLSLPYIKITSIPNLPESLDSINSSASAFVVYDTESRSVIAGKNQSLRFSPASTAKIMAAVVTLAHYNLDEYLTIPVSVYTVQGSKMNLVAGEELTVRSLLYGMMLPSGNDAAYTLAFYYPGGIAGFVNAMNDKAKELKLSNTHFDDPDGFEDGNFTTGIELARLASYAMQNETFREIVSTQNIQVANKNGSHKYFLKNLNELLAYQNVVGIKTGFTNEAGGVLVTGIKKDGKLLIVVVLKSQDRFSDTEDLMRFINEKVDFSVTQFNLTNQ